MINRCLIWLLPIFFLLPAIARADASAEALVKNVTEEVLTILREDKGIQSGNRQRAIALIENKVAPHFDFARMTSLAVGRAWREASAEQRKALTEEFRKLLVRTYANSLTAYRDQTVTFKPGSHPGEDGEVTVHSQINQPGNRPTGLDYSLARSAGGGWKVFDVTIAGVSLVTTYRGSFTSEVDKSGVDGLLRALQERNRRIKTAAFPAA